MAKTRRRTPQPTRKAVTFVAWFRKEDWSRWREMVSDKPRFAGTFDAWLANAKAMVQKMEWKGHTVKTVVVDPEECAAWCQERGRPLDAPHRSAYAVFVGTNGLFDPTKPPKRPGEAPAEPAAEAPPAS